MKNNIYTCIEIGSFEIKLLVCNFREERLFVLTQKCVASAGIDRGQITNFDKLVNQIKKVKKLAEQDLKQPLKNIVLTIPPIDITIEYVMGRLNLDVKQPIQTDDVRKLFRQVMEQSHYEGVLPVGLVPRQFKIDENHIVQNPRGLSGMNLGIEASRILMSATPVANLVHAVESSGFKVDEIIVGSIAETLLVLETPEMYARTCHINIGHGMTSLTIVNDGKIIQARTLPIGGRDIIRAIADQFNISEELASRLKIRYGQINAHTFEEPSQQVIYIDEQASEMKFITRAMLNAVITEVVDGIFKNIRQHIVDELRLREQEYHYSLSGGVAELPNILTSLQNQLPMAASIFRPSMLGIRNTKFSSIIGTAILAHELTLLLGTNPNAQKFEFETPNEVEKVVTPRFKTKQDIIPQVEKVSPPKKQVESPTSLKEAIAGVASVGVEEKSIEKTKKIPIYDDLIEESAPLLEDAGLEIDETYIDQKLSNSGALARFFGRILNENDEEEKLK